MKILVTGHRGFIGSHVYEHLTELGFDVDGYDIPYDIGDFKTNKKYDVVIHLQPTLPSVKLSKILMHFGKTM